MKNILTYFFLALVVSCAPKEQDVNAQSLSMYDSPLIDAEVALKKPYELNFEVEKVGDVGYQMIATIKLFGGSFYVSPHSTTDFKGKFRIEIAPNENLILGNDFVETPRSKEVIDPHPFVDGPVNWVSVDTKYEYPLIIRSEEDFDIGGKIIFTIEPKCTLEEIPVMFKFRSGVLTVEPWKC
jgi:hypothetical protein